jgi:Flp pilus assembly protein TadG
MHPSGRLKHQQTKGIALLEFIILAPTLLVLLFMAAEFGRALYQYNTLTKAVYTGARYYAAHVLGDQATARSNATLLIRYGSVTDTSKPILPFPDNITVTFEPDPHIPHAQITVTATYPYIPIDGDPLNSIILNVIGSPSGFGPLVLTASVSMRAI